MVIGWHAFSDEILTRIRRRVESDPMVTRSGLSREVCDWMGWHGHDGRPREVSCRVALLKLHRRGVIELPEQQPMPCRESRPKAPATPWAGLSIETSLAELGEVRLIPVSAEQAALSGAWRSMMQTCHPLGAGPLCGAQLRYLVACDAGYLGGLSFSAAAWRLAPRDAWIGWDDETRQKGLNSIINNSRFLILPGVRVKNLASHILGQAAKRLAADWSQRYGITPVLLETFVDREHYRGTCYRAANWMTLGQTQGQGRQGTANGRIKDILVYPLDPGWQAHLRGNSAPCAPPRVAAADWAEEEFGSCALPDARLQARLCSLARDFYARPTANLTQACGTRAKTKAAYRFFDHEHTTMQTLLASHYQATEERLRQESVILAVQDTSSANYTTHPATTGMGPISTTADGPQGLELHSTLAFTTQGTPLGFVNVQCWQRDPAQFGKKAQRSQLPIEEKESYKWLRSYQAVAQIQARCPSTMVVSVGDREADLYELFALAVTGGPKLLVRARNNRKLQGEQRRLWETMQARAVDAVQVLRVPRQGSRAARDAQMTIRYAAVSLMAPAHHKGPAIPVWAVFAQEQNVPDGVTPLEWMLLTTVPATGIEGACDILMWYSLRWGIEVLHRTLKSGCRIEQRQLRDAQRIESCLAIDLVVAWRIFYLTKLGRDVPQAPCTIYFEEAQWKALMVFTTKNPVPPDEAPTLREAIHRVAGLGGFLGRKGDGEPGTQTLWLGLQRLDDITGMWKVFNDIAATQPRVSRRRDSG